MTFLAVIFVVLSPVIVFLVLPIAAWASRGWLESAARTFACLSCGGILGLEALRLADTAWSEHVHELREKHPFVLFRLVRNVHAICPTCGARYAYVERERTFAPVNPPSVPTP
jgi:hypothetical protein